MMRLLSRGRAFPASERASSPGLYTSDQYPEPQIKEQARVDRVVRRRVPGVPDLEPRGRGLRDPDRLDGADPDGPSQGDRLPAVRLRLYGQCRPRGRAGGAGGPHGPAGRLGHLRELPVRMRGRRPAELLGRSHLCHERRLSLPLLRRRPARSGSSGGTWRSSSSPKSPRSATSSAWWACPTR